MKGRYVLAGLAAVAVFSMALPAIGAAPDPLVSRALGTAQRADQRSKDALRLARRVSREVGQRGVTAKKKRKKKKSLSSRVRTLEKRVSSLAVMKLRQKIVTESKVVTSTSNGFATGTVSCPYGTKVVGGGGEWLGRMYRDQTIMVSRPEVRGWTAMGALPFTSAGWSFRIHAICTRL